MGVWPRDAARRSCELVSPAASDMMPLPRYDPCSQGDSPRTVHRGGDARRLPTIASPDPASDVRGLLCSLTAPMGAARAPEQAHDKLGGKVPGRRTRIALCSNGDLWLAILGSSLRDRRPVGRPQCLDVPALQDDGSISPARSSATEGEGMKLTG